MVVADERPHVLCDVRAFLRSGPEPDQRRTSPMPVPLSHLDHVHQGTTPQADLGVQVRSPLGAVNLTHASAATDGAAASVGNIGTQVWRAPQNGMLVAAWWEPTGADQPAADAASYRTQSIRSGGADGTGTRILASASAVASQASNTTRGLTLDSNPVFNRGDVIYGAYSATVGGTHAGTLVRAGHFSFSWSPL